MKKVQVIGVLLVLSMGLLVACGGGVPSIEKLTDAFEAEGYEVGSSYDRDMFITYGVRNAFAAVKGDESISVMFFDDTDSAETYYDFIATLTKALTEIETLIEMDDFDTSKGAESVRKGKVVITYTAGAKAIYNKI